ncbi:MAG TPA: DUF3592 domain-containing protein [Reyranella sp.]|nr:DUF3592 domain-containing protein [Reyranella sp.]
MELSVNDKITANPSADEIGQAIDAAPHPEDWYLVLESEDGSSLDVNAEPGGTYEVIATDKDDREARATSLTARQIKAILLKYHAGDAEWRDGFSWSTANSASARPAAPARGGSPPAWALGIVVGTVVLVILTFMVVRGTGAHSPLIDSDYFYVGLIAAPMVVLIVVAVLAKMLEVHRAAAWSTGVGRVVKSGTEAQHHRFAGGETEVKTVPVVQYEFSAGGRTWRGNRISIGEDAGGANIQDTLARYRQGAVVTVYYDPANPKNCVLERDIPKGVGKGLAILLGFGVVLAAVIYLLVTIAPGLVEECFPKANSAVVVIAAAVGVLVLLFFFASYRFSRKAADWPLVRGTILQSGTEKVESRVENRRQIVHVPVVEYRYRVSDVDYVSRQIKLGVKISGSQRYAAGVAARYPEGGTVDVHYDPANPSSAALENPTGMSWLLLVVALACFGVAAYASGALS